MSGNAITLGVTVTEFVDGKKHSVTVPIIDWAHPVANSFVASEEMEVLTVPGTHTRRPDIVGFVNGIPLLIIEAKRPDSGNPNKSMVDEGISQTIRNQGQEEIPHLFAYAHLLLSIGMTDGRYGTTKTPRKFWAQWREEEFSEDHFSQIKNAAKEIDPRAAILKNHVREVRDHFQHLWSDEQAVTAQDRLLIGLCTPERLLEFVRSYVLFDRKVDKIVARHQQFFGKPMPRRRRAGECLPAVCQVRSQCRVTCPERRPRRACASPPRLPCRCWRQHRAARLQGSQRRARQLRLP